MAYQHGKLLQKEIRNSAIDVLAKKNQMVISEAAGLLSNKIINKLVVLIYENFLVPILSFALPKEEKKVLSALAKGANLESNILLQAYYQADGLMFLSRISMMKYLFWRFPKRDIPGCSSAVVSKELTSEKKLLVMRNQDYPIVGTWEKNTLIAYCEPSEKNLLPHIFVSSAGLHTSGLTAMNNHGITVAAHAHFGEDISFFRNSNFLYRTRSYNKGKKY